MEKITIVEYARRNGLVPINVRHKCERGGYETAEKIGRDWFISPDEPTTDRRIKNGKLIGARAKRREKQETEKD